MSQAIRRTINRQRFPARPTDNIRLTEPFAWNQQRSDAALLLAEGHTRAETAARLEINKATLFDWLKHPDFSCEVDRLSVMVGFANRAERIRRAARVLQARLDDNEVLRSDKDSLDWVKYIQSETDGAKIDLSKLSELFTGDTQADDSRLLPPAIEVEAGHNERLSLPPEPSADSQPQQLAIAGDNDHNI